MPRKPANPQPAVFRGTGKRLSQPVATAIWGSFGGFGLFMLLDTLETDHIRTYWQAPALMMLLSFLACWAIVRNR
jgi:hypothetical protein